MLELNSLDEVRQNIDRIDRDIVRLISERAVYVRQAAKFKKTTDDVKAPKRVEEVIGKVRSMAVENGVSPDIVEQVYRAMIASFINYEMSEHSKGKL